VAAVPPAVEKPPKEYECIFESRVFGKLDMSAGSI
jgi:hypothetical protein